MIQVSSPQECSITITLSPSLSLAYWGCSTAVFATLLLLSAQQLLSCCQRLFRSVVGLALFAHTHLHTHTHTQALSYAALCWRCEKCWQVFNFFVNCVVFFGLGLAAAPTTTSTSTFAVMLANWWWRHRYTDGDASVCVCVYVCADKPAALLQIDSNCRLQTHE